MIRIGNKPIDSLPSVDGFTPNTLQQGIADTMLKSQETYRYDSADQLVFELRLRNSIVNAARDFGHSGVDFKIFRKSMANPDFWHRTSEGGFQLQSGVKPSDAIRDIYRNGPLYGTECSTAMIIIYYKALLDVFPDELFNRLYQNIYLMNWQHLDRDLAIVDQYSAQDQLPGDARYFINPDVDPLTPEWQGENAFYLGNGKYFGHGIGIESADAIIKALNSTRKPGADRSAYLLDSVKRQNYKVLYNSLKKYQAAA
jgi:protein-glutamine gamma-glutamyltransferase